MEGILRFERENQRRYLARPAQDTRQFTAVNVHWEGSYAYRTFQFYADDVLFYKWINQDHYFPYDSSSGIPATFNTVAKPSGPVLLKAIIIDTRSETDLNLQIDPANFDLALEGWGLRDDWYLSQSISWDVGDHTKVYNTSGPYTCSFDSTRSIWTHNGSTTFAIFISSSPSARNTLRLLLSNIGSTAAVRHPLMPALICATVLESRIQTQIEACKAQYNNSTTDAALPTPSPNSTGNVQDTGPLGRQLKLASKRATMVAGRQVEIEFLRSILDKIQCSHGFTVDQTGSDDTLRVAARYLERKTRSLQTELKILLEKNKVQQEILSTLAAFYNLKRE